MKIAILGGAFNPPHLGHQIIATELKEQLKVDEVWLMPVYDHPFDKSLSSALSRLEMTKLLENDFIRASDFEMRLGKKSFTIDTLRLLSNKYPDDEFIWCIGSDMIKDFEKWKEWQKLLSDYRIVVYPRGNDQIMMVYEGMEILSGPDMVVTNISSSLIRARIRDGKGVDHLVSGEVWEYIIKNKLYKK